MIIEKPAYEDIPQIIELINSDKKHLIPRNKKEISRKLHFWRVAKDNDRVVACGCFDAYSRRMAEIRSFIVDEGYRGRGIAKELLAELMKMVRPNQQVFVVTSVPEFFQKNEFDTCLGEKYIMFYKNK
ncbi:MAG: GNAT family N-acetyltransferase [Patescibacteria group bacterium]